MKRFHARVAVIKELQAAGLYIETKDNPMTIPVCRCVNFVYLSARYSDIKWLSSKSGDVIEPLLKPQWWVSCKPLAEEAVKVS